MLIGRRRLLALGVWLVVSAVVWNGVFDRRVESAVERYLKAPGAAAPAGGLRVIMQPAIDHAARVATTWALAVFVPGAVVIAFVRRRPRAPSRPQPSAR